MKLILICLMALFFSNELLAQSDTRQGPILAIDNYNIGHPYLHNIDWKTIDPFYKTENFEIIKDRYLIIKFTKQESIGKKTLSMALGSLVAYLAHEAGHAGVAKIYDHNLNFDFQDDAWSCEQDCSEDIKQIAMGGMLGQKVAAELVLLNGGPSNSFEEGVLIFDLINSIGYTFANEISPNYGDFRYFERSEQRVFGITISAHAIYRSGKALWNHWKK